MRLFASETPPTSEPSAPQQQGRLVLDADWNGMCDTFEFHEARPASDHARLLDYRMDDASHGKGPVPKPVVIAEDIEGISAAATPLAADDFVF